ncbi:hypothetical protein DFJ67_0242 [Asanoa ferruginea]|uniref:Uncharacterized protein n=1 Tax=Asanoa ferruginea TaxID=53367 RepID=A0A3D9ZAL1_9ACTN|nr:hypothetical protein [Asanoa ferruginea]REF94325.1 hypothetical protein DFJ67_0242 [Asanoa ferruginea]GIF52309.1 hypothetical protein Afe04nite_68480 [Asanoa ferruginea]
MSDGVSISGGTFHGPVAAGKEASATVNYHSPVSATDLDALLGQLRTLIDQASDRAAARAAVEDVEEAVSRPTDAPRLANRLRSARDRFEEVGAAAGLIAAIAQACGIPWN